MYEYLGLETLGLEIFQLTLAIQCTQHLLCIAVVHRHSTGLYLFSFVVARTLFLGYTLSTSLRFKELQQKSAKNT